MIPKDQAVLLTATVRMKPDAVAGMDRPKWVVALHWPLEETATRYAVSRRLPGEAEWQWTERYSGPGTLTGWEDWSVSDGTSMEYRVVRTGTLGTATGYILVGVRAPAVLDRGKIVLIVDVKFAESLKFEINRLVEDLTGDCWTVIRHDITLPYTTDQVKSAILNDYNADPTNVKAVLLLGKIPVQMSGDMSGQIDGHGDSKFFPADTFYGCMTGEWNPGQTQLPL